MDSIVRIFKERAEGAHPVITPGTQAILPSGIENLMTSTDMIVGPSDIKDYHQSPEDVSSMKPDTVQELQWLAGKVSNEGESAGMTHFNDPVIDENAICVVSASPDDSWKEKGSNRSSEIMAFLNPEKFDSPAGYKTMFREYYPGAENDWRALDLLHENGHCEDFKDDGLTGSRNQRETTGDAISYRDYYNAYSMGLVSDPEVPYAYRAVRAIDTMLMGGKDYGATSLISLPQEKDILSKYESPDEAFKDLMEARTDVLQAVGGLTAPTKDEYKKAFREILAEGVEMKDAMQEGDVAPAYREEHKNKMDALAGERLITEQPELLYEVSRQMLHKGAFDDNTTGKTFVERFVDGVQRYEPEMFHVDPADRPEKRPDIVDRIVDSLPRNFTNDLGTGLGK